MASRSREGRQTSDRIGSDAGAVWLAHRYAPCAEPERRSLGGTIAPAKPADSSAHTLFPPEDLNSAARIYQEDAEDPSGSSRIGEAQMERGHAMRKRNKHVGSSLEMARRMRTSRAALDRLLAPGNASVTLQTLTRAAHAVGRDLRIELV
jgi:hypothetical protein